MSKLVSNTISIIIIVAFIVGLFGIVASFVNQGKKCKCSGFETNGMCFGMPHSCVQKEAGELTNQIRDARNLQKEIR